MAYYKNLKKQELILIDISIYEFTRKQTSVVKSIEHAKTGVDQVHTLFNKAVKKDTPAKEADELRELANNAIIALNDAEAQLREYNTLLTAIANATRIAWPPIA